MAPEGILMHPSPHTPYPFPFTPHTSPLPPPPEIRHTNRTGGVLQDNPNTYENDYHFVAYHSVVIFFPVIKIC